MGFKTITHFWENLMAFKEIFKDANDWNEKNILGFISFGIMCLYALLDIITGLFNLAFPLHEFVYQSFIWITLGSFGISGIESFSSSHETRIRQEKEETDK